MIRDNTGDRYAQKMCDLTIKLQPDLSVMFGRNTTQHGCSKRCNDKTNARHVNQIEFTQDKKHAHMRLGLSVPEIVGVVVAHSFPSRVILSADLASTAMTALPPPRLMRIL